MLGCGAYVAAALAGASLGQRRAFAAESAGEIAAETRFARVEKVAEGAWAVISTPQGGQFTTVSNGGIVAGNDAVLAIEGFMNPAGATWLRDVAKEIAGRAPTHVVRFALLFECPAVPPPTFPSTRLRVRRSLLGGRRIVTWCSRATRCGFRDSTYGLSGAKQAT
jgi:hypothetical protein